MNKSNRRKFLKHSAIMLSGSSLLSKFSYANKGWEGEIMGIQLYSVRDDMKKDPLGTLKELAEMGYKYVEHANYVDRSFYGYAPNEFKKILDDHGLKMLSGHTVLGPAHWNEAKDEFTDLWKETVEDAAAVGQVYVISPSLDNKFRKDRESLLRFMDVFNKSGELCKTFRMKFGYHNHDFEFSEKFDDDSIYDLILANTDANLVIQQLDTGNLFNGGANAFEIVRKYPGRFLSLHVKDEIKQELDDKYESTILGAGVAELKDLLDIVKTNSTGVHYIIEQEAYQDKTPMECAGENYAVMKKWGF